MHKLTDKQITDVIHKAAEKLYNYCKSQDLHYTITGVSGGLDSAVTLGIAAAAREIAQKQKYAFHNIGLILPCLTDPKHTKRGEEAIHRFKAREIKIELDELDSFIEKNHLSDIENKVKKALKETDGTPFSTNDSRIARGNLRCRMRMMLGTYHVARLMHGIVLSTDNYSEYLMGFWTICGDVGDFAPIQKVLKGMELYDIAKGLGVPQSIIDATPDDGLGIHPGGDEGQLGANYETIDRIMIELLKVGLDPDNEIDRRKKLPNIEGINPERVQHIWDRACAYAFKRRGTIHLSRADLGLPKIEKLDTNKSVKGKQ